MKDIGDYVDYYEYLNGINQYCYCRSVTGHLFETTGDDIDEYEELTALCYGVKEWFYRYESSDNWCSPVDEDGIPVDAPVWILSSPFPYTSPSLPSSCFANNNEIFLSLIRAL